MLWLSGPASVPGMDPAIVFADHRSVTAAGAQRTTGVQNPGSNRGLATNIICSSGDPRRRAVC